MVEKIAPKAEKNEKSEKKKPNTVQIIPLGGVDGIGMNMTAFEYGEDILLVDCGMAFPEENMPGVDVVIPDFTYLVKNAHKVRGLVLTHGHEDHIGAVPYLLKKVPCEVYGTRLTLGILDGKLAEHNIRTQDLYEVRAGEMITLGTFDVEFIHVNHSMPDAVALCITTPCGRIVHTGDFKIDFTPIGTTPIDLGRFAELGRKGVKLLMCDSTNAERPGYTPSESTLNASFDRIFRDDKRRVVIATFSSNVHRVQQILEACAAAGRKVALTGRSLQNVLRAAQRLGYIEIPEGLVIDIADCKYFPPEQLAIITTGSQGEPMSALYRMAFGAHPMVSLSASDLV
ncbi:MAG: ribonuclease J, partial [Clostridia bacterium]|nr:ribonuclease J [Clostridia bacterium]